MTKQYRTGISSLLQPVNYSLLTGLCACASGTPAIFETAKKEEVNKILNVKNNTLCQYDITPEIIAFYFYVWEITNHCKDNRCQ